MTERLLRILQVNTADIGGGAAKVAQNLSQVYRARGHASWLAVGFKYSHDPDILLIPNHVGHRWSHFWWGVHSRLQLLDGRMRGVWRPSRLARRLAEPGRLLDAYRGVEDFRFPGTWRLLRLTPQPPDLAHCHNLHGGYFDLHALPWLSQQIPVVVTLHDAWLLSGHCAHSFDCARWKTGCGHCPDLTIYPAVQRDATAHNWRRKREIYVKSRLCVATPSRWLMQKVDQSMLAPAVVEARVIPNGVDLSVFHPADRQVARAALSIPQDTRVLLSTAKDIRRKIWKDYQTMRAAVALVAGRLQGQRVLFIALGEDAPAERIGQAEVRFVPYQKDPQMVARYYHAADVYVYAARADTFPNTVLEALTCATPVVATAVGGVPEQIEDGCTGFLVPPGDAEAMAARIEQLLSDDDLYHRFSTAAAETAHRRFDLNRQADEYLAWYRELTAEHRRQTAEREMAAEYLRSAGIGGSHA